MRINLDGFTINEQSGRKAITRVLTSQRMLHDDARPVLEYLQILKDARRESIGYPRDKA
jgi:hypothetical protein